MHLRRIQMPVANQLARQQQHGNLVPKAQARVGIAIDVDDVHRHARDVGKGCQIGEHVLAKAAAGARI